MDPSPEEAQLTALYVAAREVFYPPAHLAGAEARNEAARRLASILSGITLETLELDVAFETKRGGQAPGVHYYTIYEDDYVSLTVFILSAGAQIPLHDHPSMSVVSRVLAGQMRCRMFSWASQSPHSMEKAAGLPGLPPNTHIPSNLLVGEAQLVSERVLTSDDVPVFLLPTTANLHDLAAVTDCAFIDVQCPGYDTTRGRTCHYYREIPFNHPLVNVTPSGSDGSESASGDASGRSFSRAASAPTSTTGQWFRIQQQQNALLAQRIRGGAAAAEEPAYNLDSDSVVASASTPQPRRQWRPSATHHTRHAQGAQNPAAAAAPQAAPPTIQQQSVAAARPRAFSSTSPQNVQGTYPDKTRQMQMLQLHNQKMQLYFIRYLILERKYVQSQAGAGSQDPSSVLLEIPPPSWFSCEAFVYSGPGIVLPGLEDSMPPQGALMAEDDDMDMSDGEVSAT